VFRAGTLDARQRHLVLTNVGTKLIRRLRPLWQAMEEAALEVDAEGDNAVAALDRLDEVLARQSLFERIIGKLSRANRVRRVRPRKS